MIGNNYIRTSLTRIWWIPLLAGLVCIGFGVWCILSPMTSLPVFSYIFAGCLCGAGLLNLIYACANAKVHTGWGWTLALGLLDLIAGIWLFILPEPVLVQTFIFIVGIWMLVVAINSISEAMFFSSYSPFAMVWMILLLIAACVFAVIFLSNPIAGGVAVWLWIGISLILFGVYRLTFAFSIRSLTRMR